MKQEQQEAMSDQSVHCSVDDQEGCINIAGVDVGFDELVGPSMAAKIVGLSPRSLRRLVSQGEIPVYRYAPNSMRYLVRDLMEWTEVRRVEAALS